jgi:ELWxxDGT repeat protein
VRVKNAAPGLPGNLVDVSGTLYFGSGGLWKCDGTDAGTVQVSATVRELGNLTNVGGTLYFTSFDDVSGTELWKSDGTEAGTVRVKDIRSGVDSSLPSKLVDVGGLLYFTANDGVTGSELWKSDGTEAGTVLVKDIRSGISGSLIFNLVNVGGKVRFSSLPTTALVIICGRATARKLALCMWEI